MIALALFMMIRIATLPEANWAIVPAFLFIAIWLLGVWRIGWLGAYVRGDELRIQNLFRTHRIKRERIESFGLDLWEGPLTFGQSIGTVYLKDGAKTQITALLMRTPVWNYQLDSIEHTLEELNRWIRRPD